MASERGLFVPVEEEFMGPVIGTKGRKIKEIQENTQTRIRSRNGRESGFEITGTPYNCEQAELAIRRSIDNASIKMMEPVPQEFVRLLTASNSNENFREIQNEHGVKIFWPKFTGKEEHVIFTIKGSRVNCERARNKLRANIEKWKEDRVSEKPVLSTASEGFRTHSKIKNEPRIFRVSKEHINLVVGKDHKDIEIIKKKSKTEIIVPSRQRSKEDEEDTVPLKIFGSPENCNRAVSLIRQRIVAFKDKRKRIEYGVNVKFVCLDFKGEDEEFQLRTDNDTPMLNGFIKGRRYRIETVAENESDSECDFESEIDNARTVSEIEKHLLGPLHRLEQCKDKEELLTDLWCHFGKVLVSSVDEAESKNVIKPADIKRRLKRAGKNAFWNVSFEEGVKPLDINQDALPKTGDETVGDLKLRLAHTQWRYDFGFNTPSERNVRLKVWQNLPPDMEDEPPVEVKHILNKVILEDDKNIKAWICHPSTTVLRGEIMIPSSRYDCRMKLRTGPRHVANKDSVCIEEDKILSDYLSHCQIDTLNHKMDIPDKRDLEMPEGFGHTFYREAEEKIYRASFENEEFMVIVLDQKGWDSDTSQKRLQEQFGVRVVLDAWTEDLLSPKRNWNAKKILSKLGVYMKFLCLLQNELF